MDEDNASEPYLAEVNAWERTTPDIGQTGNERRVAQLFRNLSLISHESAIENVQKLRERASLAAQFQYSKASGLGRGCPRVIHIPDPELGNYGVMTSIQSL